MYERELYLFCVCLCRCGLATHFKPCWIVSLKPFKKCVYKITTLFIVVFGTVTIYCFDIYFHSIGCVIWSNIYLYQFNWCFWRRRHEAASFLSSFATNSFQNRNSFHTVQCHQLWKHSFPTKYDCVCVCVWCETRPSFTISSYHLFSFICEKSRKCSALKISLNSPWSKKELRECGCLYWEFTHDTHSKWEQKRCPVFCSLTLCSVSFKTAAKIYSQYSRLDLNSLANCKKIPIAQPTSKHNQNAK